MSLERKDFDVTVVGGGVAGSETARVLGSLGLNVALIEKRGSLQEKSWMLNSDNFDSDFVQKLRQRNLLIPLSHYKVVHSSDQKLTFNKMGGGDGKRTTTFVTFHPDVINVIRKEFSSNVEVIQEGVSSSFENKDGVEVFLFNGRVVRSDYLVDASGDYSPVSRRHRLEGQGRILDDDPFVLWVKGIRAFGEFKEGTLIDPVGRKIGISWVLPYSKNVGDVVACNICRLSELGKEDKIGTLKRLVEFCETKDLCYVEKIDIRYESFIRCEPVRESVARKTRRLYQVGASAGMGSPLLAEVFPAAYKWA